MSLFTPAAPVANQQASSTKALTLFGNHNTAIAHKRNTITMPKPQWHAPWKLYRVISGHLGWVRCIDVDPSNEWFVTGAGDRIIKVSNQKNFFFYSQLNVLIIYYNLRFGI